MHLHWPPPERPVDHAEHSIVAAILQGHFPPGSALPAERELSAQLGVTRPTLREALRRLERDGWLIVRQGKSTVVADFRKDGGLNVLSGIIRYSTGLPPDFVPNLLQVRLDLAPTYTRLAVERSPDQIVSTLANHNSLDDTPQTFAAFDWSLQRALTAACGNPVYAWILNSFAGFYEHLALLYFSLPDGRSSSRSYYAALIETARRADGDSAEQTTRTVMQESIMLWQRASAEPGGS